MKLFNGYDFWSNFSKELASRGLTNMAFAEKAELPYRTITTQRNRHSIPNAEQLYKMATVLGTSIEYLLTGEDSSLCIEAKEVERDPELRQLVRLCINDRSLVSLIAHAIRANDMKTKDKNIG